MLVLLQRVISLKFLASRWDDGPYTTKYGTRKAVCKLANAPFLSPVIQCGSICLKHDDNAFHIHKTQSDMPPVAVWLHAGVI